MNRSRAIHDHEPGVSSRGTIAAPLDPAGAIDSDLRRVLDGIDGPDADGRRDLGNWVVVDDFRHGSKRYLLLCEKVGRASRLEALTQSERKVIDYAARGLCTKEIATELAIAPATVRVLLMRAVRKSGVKSRVELVALWAQAVAGAAEGASG